jgi:Na+-translocating ferredoxin:NAD+ oxidoreductase RnfD subunit
LNRSGDVVLQTLRAAERIQDYLQAHVSSDRHVRTLTQLVSDELPPLEDLVILGQPSTIGQASGIGLLIGGLFLVHRRMMPFRIPVMMLMVLAVLLLILPTPIVIGSDQTVSRWLAARDGRVGWAVGLTFVNYLLFASSSLAVFFFLASRPGVRPLGRHSSMVYAILIGTLSAVLIRFVSVEWGPLMAVAMIQPLTPWLDRRIVSRPI